MKRKSRSSPWRTPIALFTLLLLLLVGGFLFARREAIPIAAKSSNGNGQSSAAAPPPSSGPATAQPAAQPAVQSAAPTAAQTEPSGHLVSGNIIDRRTGQSIEGATVRAGSAQTQTAGDGSFALSVPALDTSVTIEAPGYDPVTVSADTDLSRLELRPNAVKGQIVDAVTGQPIQGAQITAGGKSVTSTVSGEFTLEDLPPDAMVMVAAGGYERTKIDSLNEPTVKVALKPWTARGLYATSYGIANARLRGIMEDALANSQLNTIVIDVKGDYAFILYPSEVPLAEKIGANDIVPYPDIEELIRKYHDQGYYVIARIDVFKDDYLARNGAKAGVDVAIKRPDGSVWIDGEDLGWVDPFREEVWDYVIELSKEAARKGFDEINYDYIRFPTDEGVGSDLETAIYSKPNTEENRVAAITGFLKKADEALKPYGVAISIDTFGYTTWWTDDGGIGQFIPLLADHVDYICPMVYPSTFSAGLPTDPPIPFPDVVNHPYEVVYASTKRAVERTQGKRAKIRPWIQYFDDYPWQTGKEYNAEEIRAQVQGAVDAGGQGWLYWDVTNKYYVGPVIVDKVPEPQVTPTPGSAASPSPAAGSR